MMPTEPLPQRDEVIGPRVVDGRRGSEACGHEDIVVAAGHVDQPHLGAQVENIDGGVAALYEHVINLVTGRDADLDVCASGLELRHGDGVACAYGDNVVAAGYIDAVFGVAVKPHRLVAFGQHDFGVAEHWAVAACRMPQEEPGRGKQAVVS